MAESRARARREHAGEPAPFQREQRVADGVDPAVDGMEVPARQTMVDRPAPQAEPGQLRPGDHPVLARRDRRDREVSAV